MRPARGAQTILFVRGYLPFAGGALDNPRLDSGAADTLGDFLHVNFGDLIDRALLEVRRAAEVFFVQPGGADDIDARGRCDLGHEIHVASYIHRTGIDEGRNAQVFQLLQPLDAGL